MPTVNEDSTEEHIEIPIDEISKEIEVDDDCTEYEVILNLDQQLTYKYM